MKKPTVLACVAVLCFPAMAMAAYTGPQAGNKAFASVAEIREYPVNDGEATLTGHIIRKVGHETYLFQDGTGTLRVEIDHEMFPAEDVNEKTLVRIVGEIEAATLDRPSVDASSLEIIKTK